jgi:hypothetical protein
MEDSPPMPMGDCLKHHIKLWGDRYPFTAEVKGSATAREPGKFYLVITSNYLIDWCFSKAEDVAAVKRRFWEIEMNEDNKVMIQNWRRDPTILQEGPQKRGMGEITAERMT